ncbi:ATP-binding protein [Patescibacteria group bacterium]
MKRKIIQINEEKCTGCGLCVNICAEAALEVIDGKAKLIKDFYCDGMGACLDVCPEDALKIVEKDASDYDTQKTYEHVKKTRGEDAAKEVHGIDNDQKEEEPMKCGCPGSMMQDFTDKTENNIDEKIELNSELRQWPIQLHLVSPLAPYLKNADLVVAADCVAFTYANFHQEFLKGKILIIFCPKLDADQDIYKEKLIEIFKNQNINSITTVKMEVPCCSGVESLVDDALSAANKNIPVGNNTISIQGQII